MVLALEAVRREHAAQKPDELAHLIDWLRERPAPRRVLEVGVYLGGTLWLWRRLWPLARLVGVDRSPGPCAGCERRRAHIDCPRRRIKEALGGWPRGRMVVGDSSSPMTLGYVSAALEGGCDFLHIDGDHSAEGVRSDFELYSRLIRPGGAIVLHDVASEAYPDVVDLWQELWEPGAFTILEPEGDDWGGLGVLPR